MLADDLFKFLSTQSPEQIDAQMENFKSGRNKMLRQLFGNYMKGNLLIKIKEEILKSKEYVEDIFINCFDINVDRPIIGLGEDPEFIVSLNLVMIYYYLTLFDNDGEKSKKNNDENFINELKERTLFQCKLNKLATTFGKSYYYLEHIPIYYSTNCMVNYMLEILQQRCQNKSCSIETKNIIFKLNHLLVSLKTIKSILLLVASGNNGCACSLLRNLTEMYCIYFAVGDNEGIAKEYYRFKHYRIDYELSGDLPEEFTKIIPDKRYTFNYLNYGWIDKFITNRKQTIKYKFSDLVDIAEISNDMKDMCKTIYSYCSKYSHGDYQEEEIDKNIFLWIISRIGLFVMDFGKEFAKVFVVDFKYNDINLAEFLVNSITELDKAFYKHNKIIG